MLRIVTNRIKCEIIDLIDLLLRLARESRWFSFVVCWMFIVLVWLAGCFVLAIFIVIAWIGSRHVHSYVSMISRTDESKSVCFYLCIARSKSIDAFCVKFIIPPKGEISHRRMYRDTELTENCTQIKLLFMGFCTKTKTIAKTVFTMWY